MGTNRGRPPHPEPVTPAEAKVLELVREGMHNAEIAVRLGLSVNTVRYHVSNLLTKAGVESREALAKWEPSHGGGWRWLVLHLAIPKAASIVVAGLGTSFAALAIAVIVLTQASNGSGAVEENLPPPGSTAAVSSGWSTRVIDGVEFVEVGPLITVNSNPSNGVQTAEQRATAGVIRLESPGVVHFIGPHMEQVRNGAIYGQGTNGKSPIAINVWPTIAGTTLAPIAGGGETVDALGGKPELLVWVTETRGVGQNTQGLSLYRSAIDASGELWVSVDPIPASAVIDINTGEAVDVSKARFLGVVAPQSLWTSCDAGGLCSVGVSGGGFPVPSNGQVRCDAKLGVELLEYASGIRLQFTPSVNPPPPPCSAPPREVIANDIAVSGYYSASAFDASGAPISVAVAGDGTVYAGVFGTTVGCPCFPRN